MAVTFSQEPTYPIPGKPVRLSFVVDTGNFVKVYVTDAPRDSLYWKQLNDAGASRVLLHAGDDDKPWKFTPDVSGVYQFAVDDITKGAAGYGGGYYNSPDSYQEETVNGGASTLTVTVGTKMEMVLGADDDTATLRLYVWDNYCRQTNVETHGEATPALVDASSERMENIIRDSTVQTLLAGYADAAAETLSGATTVTFHALLDSIIDNFNGHAADLTYHYTADGENLVDSSYKETDNTGLFAAAISYVLQRIDAHMANDSGTGEGSGDYHQDGSGNKKVDHDNRPIVSSASDQTSAIIALAAAWRSYGMHRQDTHVHKTGDTTNVATAIPATSVPYLASTLVAMLTDTTPNVSVTINQAAPHLEAHLGMVSS